MLKFEFFVILFATHLTQMQSPFETANGVIVQKTNMKNRYSLEFRVVGRTPTLPPPHETAWNSTFHLWRDGNKFRIDSFNSQHSPIQKDFIVGSRYIGCENCEKEGYGIVTTIVPGSPIAQPMVEFRRLGSWSCDPWCTRFDWRFLGLSNDSVCSYDRLKIGVDFPNHFNRKGIVIKSDVRGSDNCVLATLKTDKIEKSVWLSENERFNPVFFEDIFRSSDTPEARTTEIVWQTTRGGHYYPKSLKHNSIISLNGIKHSHEETLTVTHADFDSPIDPAVFTISGFGLNENQVIGLPGLPLDQCPVWHQGKYDSTYTFKNLEADRAKALGTITKPASDADKIPAPYPKQGNWVLVVGVVAASISITTAVCAVVIRRRRRVRE